MYLGIDRVKEATWTLINADFAGDSDGSQLTSGRPKDITRILCATGGSEYESVTLRSVWPAARIPRIACLVGLSLPPGIAATVTGMLASSPIDWSLDLGGNSTTATTRLLPDGSVGIWWMFDDELPAIVGLSIELANNEFDAPFVPGAFIDIGEADLWRGLRIGDLGIDSDWQDGSRESTDRRGIDDTPWDEPYIAGRYLQTRASGIDWEYVYGSASTPNLATLRNRLQRGEVIAAVPRYSDPETGLVSSEVLAAHAFLGGGRRWSDIQNQGGDNYAVGIRFDEYPAAPQQ